MKKLWLLMTLLLLAACGGGGDGGGGGVNSGGEQSATTDGIVTVKFTSRAGKIVSLPASPDPTWVRIVAISTDPSGTVKPVIDVAIGSATPVTMSVPQGTYNFKAIYYVKEGSVNRLLYYGVTDIKNIFSNAETEANITMSPIVTTLSSKVRDPITYIYAGQKYGSNQPTVTDPSGALRPEWVLFAQTSPFTTLKHLGATQNPTVEHKDDDVPDSNTSGKLYFQGEFFIDGSLLKTGEEYKSWVFNTTNDVFDPYFKPQVSINVGSDIFPPRITAFYAPTEVRSTLVEGIQLSATDNVRVTGYLIKAVKADPANTNAPLYGTVAPAPGGITAQTEDLDLGWVAPFSSYSTNVGSLGLADGDRMVLYAWARDLHGTPGPSATMSATTDVKPVSVIYRATPLVTSVVAPTIANVPTDLSYEGIKISVVGTGDPSSFAITESKTSPPAAWTPWVTVTDKPSTTTASYTFSTRPIINGVFLHGTVARTLYAWVKYGSNISEPKSFTVIYSDAPVVTDFSVPENTLIDRTAGTLAINFMATSPAAYTLQYAVTTSSNSKDIKWESARPTTVTLTEAQLEQLPGTTTSIYGWVKDANGIIVYRKITIKF